MIVMQPVQSSNLTSVGYDDAARILALEFKSGAVFHFQNVPVGMWERLRDAPSPGSFFAHHIKGQFEAIKMTGPCDQCGAQGPVDTRCTDCGCGNYRREERRGDSTRTSRGSVGAGAGGGAPRGQG
jgi:hypothetical protein